MSQSCNRTVVSYSDIFSLKTASPDEIWQNKKIQEKKKTICWSTPNTYMLATQSRTYHSFEFSVLLEADSIPLTVKHVSVIRRVVFFKIPVYVLYLYVFILFFYNASILDILIVTERRKRNWYLTHQCVAMLCGNDAEIILEALRTNRHFL